MRSSLSGLPAKWSQRWSQRWSKWWSWSPTTRKRVANVTLVAGLLVGVSLLVGAVAWVITGSRVQAMQTAAIVLLGLFAFLVGITLICAIGHLIEDWD